MATTEDYDKVFSEEVYEYATDKDKSEVRRYRGLVYTRWRDRKFVEFVDVVNGHDLFQKGYHKEDQQFRKIPFVALYFAAKKVYSWENPDAANTKKRDPDGPIINHYIDMYTYTEKNALCNKNGYVLKDNLVMWNFDLTHYMRNEHFERDYGNIKENFYAKQTKLKDVEYKYLKEQLPLIEHMINDRELHGLPNRLNTLHKKVKERIEQLRPFENEQNKEDKKKSSMWASFGKIFGSRPQKNTCDIQHMLDRLATLGAGAPAPDAPKATQAPTQNTHTEPEGTYEGETSNGQRHGKGVMQYNNKNRYDGQWQYGKMNGRGTYWKNYKSENIFEWEFYGDFTDNCPINGVVNRSFESIGSQKPGGSHGLPIFTWDPYAEPVPTIAGREVTEAQADLLASEIEKDTLKKMNAAQTRERMANANAAERTSAERRAIIEHYNALHKHK
jgi:hypothetical protein